MSHDQNFAKAIGLRLDDEQPGQTIDRFCEYRDVDYRNKLDTAHAALKAHWAEDARLKRITHNWQIAFFATLAGAMLLFALDRGRWPL